MKLRIFTSGDGSVMREALELGDRMKDADIPVENFDIEDREGKEIAEVYDLYAFPSFVVVTNDGAVIESWVGTIPAEFELKASLN